MTPHEKTEWYEFQTIQKNIYCQNFIKTQKHLKNLNIFKFSIFLYIDFLILNSNPELIFYTINLCLCLVIIIEQIYCLTCFLTDKKQWPRYKRETTKPNILKTNNLKIDIIYHKNELYNLQMQPSMHRHCNSLLVQWQPASK